MKRIETGHTNEVYRDEDKIVINKVNTGLNHRLKYSNLSEFDFVPKLLRDSDEKQEWEYIDGEILSKPSNEDLTQLAQLIRKIHKSDVKLPKNNLRERIKTYLRVIHDKYVHVPEIEDNWKLMMNLLAKMGNKNPVHNDIWWQNILKDSNNKLWLVDWEYATMGDKHFDLAYYIESALLNEEQEEVFLNAYNETEDFQAYIPQWMNRYKMFVNWLTLIWCYAQDELPFPVEGLKKRINILKKMLYK